MSTLLDGDKRTFIGNHPAVPNSDQLKGNS